MDNDTFKGIILLLICISSLALIGGMIWGASIADRDMKKQAIERGYARWNNNNGTSSVSKFEWIEKNELLQTND